MFSTAADIVYFSHWFFILIAIGFSWIRSRHILHPHFIFTTIICVFLTDFLIRGYNDKNLINIEESNIYTYQSIILFIFSITIFITWFIGGSKLRENLNFFSRSFNISNKTAQIILLLAWVILIIEIIKRFSAVNWSLISVIEEYFYARGQKTWEISSYSGNFIYTLIRAILPFSGLAFAFIIANRTGIKRISASLGFIAVLILLLGNGSRTPVVMCIGVLWFYLVLKIKSKIKRITITGAFFTVVAMLTSTMYLFRSEGYAESGKSFEFIYHQDDSYYRTIFSYDYSNQSGEHWDGLFYIYAIIVNPIPRALWPDKPLLDEDFYGGFKVWYTTHLYLGEIVSIFGVIWSIPIGVLMGVIFYYILYKSTALLKYPMGIGAYLIMALYTYMCMRGMQNMMIFIYLPLFTSLSVILFNSFQKRSTTPRSRIKID